MDQPDAARALEAILALPRQEKRGKHPHKDVLSVCSDAPGAPHVYIKRQWAWDRRLLRWSDWRDGVAALPDPVREWQGLQLMASAGLNVPEALRLFHDAEPRSSRSALVMSSVPVERSLAELLQRGDVARLDAFARRDLVVALAAVADRLSECRLRWRSMKARHFYPERTVGGNWRLWLIDCEGVRTRATRRQQRRDRRILLRSLHRCGADAAFLAAAGTALLRRRGRTASRPRAASRLRGFAAFAAATGG